MAAQQLAEAHAPGGAAMPTGTATALVAAAGAALTRLADLLRSSGAGAPKPDVLTAATAGARTHFFMPPTANNGVLCNPIWLLTAGHILVADRAYNCSCISAAAAVPLRCGAGRAAGAGADAAGGPGGARHRPRAGRCAAGALFMAVLCAS